MEPEVKKERGFIRSIIRKAQKDNEPVHFLIGIGVVTIVFLWCCAVVGNSFFKTVFSKW